MGLSVTSFMEHFVRLGYQDRQSSDRRSTVDCRKQSNLLRFPDQFTFGGVDRSLNQHVRGWQKINSGQVVTASSRILKNMIISFEEKTKLLGTLCSSYKCHKSHMGCEAIMFRYVDHSLLLHTPLEREQMYEQRHPINEWNTPRSPTIHVVGDHTCTVDRNDKEVERVTQLLQGLKGGLKESLTTSQTAVFIKDWPKGASGAPGYLHCSFTDVVDIMLTCPDIGISIFKDRKRNTTIWLVLACKRAWDWVRDHVAEIHRREGDPMSILFIPNEHLLVQNDMITVGKAMSEHCSMYNCRLSIPMHGLTRLEADNASPHFRNKRVR